MNEETIVSAAIAKTDPREREAFLERACGGDRLLRGRVEALLHAHDNPDPLLSQPLQDGEQTLRPPCGTVEQATQTIGRHELQEQLGEGGFGVVWDTGQYQSVRRRAALKIIEPGMDTEAVGARIEAERQAVALTGGTRQRRGSTPYDPTISFESATSGPQPAQCDGQPDAAQRPHRFGDYEILEEVARGGMGVVYKARQISLNRIVAVKMILSGQLADEADVRRFRIEAEAAANLQHSNIVGIHEVGREAGQHYFSMEYVAGQNLAQRIRNGPLPPKQAARYVRQVAEAIDYAHRHGVTHRDIKPSNVLIDEKDLARVTDFGLAKLLQGDQRLTATNQIVGTAPYMAPEQALGSHDHVGPASDVYSIGALLYELLTGQPPFYGPTTLETLLQVREYLPKLPRQLNPRTPRELEMICLKCLEKDPNKRYPSAHDLADDLERFLNADSISLSGPSLFDRLVRTLERSHHDVEFRAWAKMLFHFAWIIFAAHFLTFLVGQARLAAPLIWLAVFRAIEFTGMAVVFWLYRAGWYPPQGRPARQLWALWLGYVVGSMVLVAMEYAMAGPARHFEYWMLYPRLAILASLGFIMMGSSYWGYCYGIGAGFLLLALIMPLNPPSAPLVFGLAWGASLMALGRHLGKLAREAYTEHLPKKAV